MVFRVVAVVAVVVVDVRKLELELLAGFVENGRRDAATLGRFRIGAQTFRSLPTLAAKNDAKTLNSLLTNVHNFFVALAYSSSARWV